MVKDRIISGAADGSIPYATPSGRPGGPVLAGAAILLSGLGMTLLGGCF